MRVRATAIICAFDVYVGVSRSRGVPLLLVGSAHSARLVTNAEAAATASRRAQECCMLAVATTESMTISLMFAVFLPDLWIVILSQVMRRTEHRLFQPLFF